MREEIDSLVEESGGKFDVTYWDTSTNGRGDVDLAKKIIGERKDRGRMIYVCGTDGFVDFWAGEKKRDAFGAKIQGTLSGLLAKADVTEDEVYKF